jgi:predicted deacylase
VDITSYALSKKYTDDRVTELTGLDLTSVNDAINGKADQADLDATNVQLVEKTQDIMNVQKINTQDFEYWIPPTQPSTSTFKLDTYNEWIGKWDEYLNEFPTYITKEKFGRDQTDTFDMFFYALTPENGYEKTMIIEACLHGNEKMGTYALYRFVYHLLHDWRVYPQLAYLRNKVRLILIPVANPYGFHYNQRRNGNPVVMGSDGKTGIDLNRNFNTDWDQYGNLGYPKGTAVYSEKETQAIRDLLVRFHDAVAFVDLHTIVTNNAMYITYVPRFSDSTFNEIRKYIDYRYEKDKAEFGFVDGYQQIDFSTAKLPSAKCHAAINHGMNAMTVEYRNQLFSANWGDSLETTKALEWFGNLIIINSKIKTKPKFQVLKDPAVRLVTFEATTQAEEISITGINSYISVDRFEDAFEIASPGILTVEGYVTIRLDASATVDLQSWVYQRYSPDYSSTKTSNTDNTKFNTTLRVLPAGIHTLPILIAIRVYPTTKNLVKSNGSEYKSKEVKVRFRARRKGANGETSGVPAMNIINYRAKTTYLPSDRGECFVHLDSSNYLDSGGNPFAPSSVRKIYPPLVSLDDSDESESTGE